MQDLLLQLWETLSAAATDYLPRLLGALAILFGFWLLALILAAIARGALRRTKLDQKVVGWVTGDRARTGVGAERWISRGLFYLVMLFGIVAFFDTLGLLMVTEPISRMLQSVLEYAPRILSAALLMLVAWIVATLVKMLLSRLLTVVQLDERLGEPAGREGGRGVTLSHSVSTAAYWLILLLFLPLVLDALALEGLLEPLQVMLAGLLGFLPNLFAALLILFVGWVAAKIARRVVTNLLAAAGLDRAGERAGLDGLVGRHTLSSLAGLLVYALILIPVAIAALDTLKLGAVSEPAGRMLSTILQGIPAVLTAAVILVLAYLVARLVAGLVSDLLSRVGFDNVLSRLGLSKEPLAGETTPSEIAGYLVLVVTLFFASIEAARQLGLEALASLLVQFAGFAGHVLLALAIFAVGLFMANLAAKVIRSGKPRERGLLATIARVAILVLVSAMALREMGLAEDIVNRAFTLFFGAAAVAAALALGLGGREAAGREVERWIRSLKASTESKEGS